MGGVHHFILEGGCHLLEMFLFDSQYLLLVLLPTLLLSFGAQMLIRNAYGKWSKRRNSASRALR